MHEVEYKIMQNINPLFNKVLIANRGEIAIRIIKTLKKMGIISVAVYSEADSNALHVQSADEAYYIGHSPAYESYLSISNIIEAARISGATAVHPAYGFLSENPLFASALAQEDITLIGPSVHAIKAMGDKVEAKKIAISANVSTVPGYIGILQNVDEAIEIAQNLGFPVIVKAAAGGGGRGMRVVHDSDQMKVAYNSAQYEATNTFNDGRLFIEKFITKPRHIEIQVLADKYGNIVCLGERECSIQRYHQKILEEAPSSFIDEEIRNQMYEQSRLLCQKVGYYSAGTVEFIMDQEKKFYFLEMNTRLQVEHPVTELITGIDIVEEMVRIAAGQKLRYTQDNIRLTGHAFEARIYAEDPKRNFLPSTGRITEYNEPPKNSAIRIDSGVAAGSEVSMYYDSMIAKVCSYDAESRTEAINKLQVALSSFVIRGISHNMSFMEAIITNPRFVDGDINTNFITEEYPDGFYGAILTSEVTETFIACGMHIFMDKQVRVSEISNQLVDQSDNIGSRWIITIDDKSFHVMIKKVSDGYNIRYGSNRIYIKGHWKFHSRLYTAIVNGKKVSVQVEKIPNGYIMTHSGVVGKVRIMSPRIAELESIMPVKIRNEFQQVITAPITGQIVRIPVIEGQEIKVGEELLVLTAMKMENVIYSHQSGKISKIFVQAGQQVATGQTLIEFEDMIN